MNPAGFDRLLLAPTKRLYPQFTAEIAHGRTALHVAKWRLVSRYRQRRCSQSHCSGYSRIQPSTTLVIACVVP